MYEESDIRTEPEDDGLVTRRKILGSAALTTAGVAAGGISAWFNDYVKSGPSLAEYEKDDQLVRTAHIGVGNRGGSLLRTALQVPGSFPVAVCDKLASKCNDHKVGIEKRLEARGQKPTVETYDDYRRVLDDKSIEAVFIATPHYLHGPMAIDAVEAGKHVYCEKAMAFTIGENQDILARVGNAGTVFQVGHQRHYSPLYRRVAQMIAEDNIGDLASIRAHWNLNDAIRRPSPTLDLERVINWRLYSEYSGGLTTEYATHQIDLANWFYGVPPHSVCGVGGVDWYRDGRDTHDHIHLILTYKVPVLKRDPFGSIDKDAAGKPKFEMTKDEKGNDVVATRQCTFDYMSSMANSHLSPPAELVMGRYGTIKMSLAGGEFFKEKKARQDRNRIAEGTNPRRERQKKILKSGVTVATAGCKVGDPIDEIALEGGRKHWSHFIEPIDGAYDKIETLLAVESFHKAVRLAKADKPFKDELKADAKVGMESAVAALMANIAMREERTVYWSEFFA